MRIHAGMIFLALAMVLATGVATSLFKASQDHHRDFGEVQTVGGPEIVQVTAKTISERTARSIELEVQGGDTVVNLNKTLITISTNNGSVPLVIT